MQSRQTVLAHLALHFIIPCTKDRRLNYYTKEVSPSSLRIIVQQIS